MQSALTLAGACLVASLLLATSVAGEVRFGRNVRIGGHDFSNQTYNRNRNAEIHLYRGQPANAGCRWVKRPGGRTRICHLKARR